MGRAGFLWNKPVVFVFVRPERHTYGFMEREDVFTLSFSMKNTAKPLSLCGTKSGRDTDKAAETGLTPVETSNGSIAFSQARLVLRMPQALCERPEIGKIPRQNYIEKMLRQRTRRPAPCLRSRDNRGSFPNKDFFFFNKNLSKNNKFYLFFGKTFLHLPCRERPLRRTRK